MSDVIPSRAVPSSPEFQANREHHLGLVREVEAAVSAVRPIWALACRDKLEAGI